MFVARFYLDGNKCVESVVDEIDLALGEFFVYLDRITSKFSIFLKFVVDEIFHDFSVIFSVIE